MYLYPSELPSSVQIFRIYITALFARYDILVTAQITLLDYRVAMQRCAPPFIIVCINIEALQCSERENDLEA